MSERVLAAVLVEPGKYELQAYPLPEPAAGCVLVKMELSGICGTDKHTYQGFTTQYAGMGGGKQIRFPIIQGHENVGTVAAIGGNGQYNDFEGIPSRLVIAWWSVRTSVAEIATIAATTSLTTFATR
jgi:D-arabinose 1-dehydrogenase-like Zn-dependent alcohol dehydrogenase